MDIQIDEEFKNLIPPLQKDEFTQLEQNIINDGCRDPLVVWIQNPFNKAIIIDGHNRYKICTDNDIEFKTEIMEFDSREYVKDWMYDNQAGKRNAHPYLETYRIGRKYDREKQSIGGQAKGVSQNGTPINTKDKIAQELKISKNTVLRAHKFYLAVNSMYEYYIDITSGNTDRTKQEIVEIYEFAKMKKYYEVETHILYNNPELIAEHTSIFKSIAKLAKKYDNYELKTLEKTDKTKEEDGREFVLWEAILEDFNAEDQIILMLKDMTIQEIEKELLLYVKTRIGIEDIWKPLISEADFEAIKEIEKEEKKQAERKYYTPKLIHGDTLKEMTKISSESIDLVVTDPPYNMDKADWDSYGSAEEFAAWMEIWLKECFRVLKPTGSIYIFGLNRMLSHVQMRMEKIGFKYKNWIIWDTVQGAGGGLWVNRQEAILYFSKSDEVYEDKDSIKLYRSEENIREYKGKTYEFKNPSNIWRFPTVDDKADDRTSHPTQKPTELIERIVKANSKENDIVLDCFMGSGTTGVVAMKNRRVSIGIERSEEYINISKKRFERVVL